MCVVFLSAQRHWVTSLLSTVQLYAQLGSMRSPYLLLVTCLKPGSLYQRAGSSWILLSSTNWENWGGPPVWRSVFQLLALSPSVGGINAALLSSVCSHGTTENNGRRTPPRPPTASPGIWTTDKRPCRTKPQLVSTGHMH